MKVFFAFKLCAREAINLTKRKIEKKNITENISGNENVNMKIIRDR